MATYDTLPMEIKLNILESIPNSSYSSFAHLQQADPDLYRHGLHTNNPDLQLHQQLGNTRFNPARDTEFEDIYMNRGMILFFMFFRKNILVATLFRSHNITNLCSTDFQPDIHVEADGRTCKTNVVRDSESRGPATPTSFKYLEWSEGLFKLANNLQHRLSNPYSFWKPETSILTHNECLALCEIYPTHPLYGPIDQLVCDDEILGEFTINRNFSTILTCLDELTTAVERSCRPQRLRRLVSESLRAGLGRTPGVVHGITHRTEMRRTLPAARTSISIDMREYQEMEPSIEECLLADLVSLRDCYENFLGSFNYALENFRMQWRDAESIRAAANESVLKVIAQLWGRVEDRPYLLELEESGEFYRAMYTARGYGEYLRFLYRLHNHAPQHVADSDSDGGSLDLEWEEMFDALANEEWEGEGD